MRFLRASSHTPFISNAHALTRVAASSARTEKISKSKHAIPSKVETSAIRTH